MNIPEKVRGIFSKKPKAPEQTREQWLCAITNLVLGGIKNERGESVFFEHPALDECEPDDLRQIGEVVLQGGVYIEIAQVCDGINNVGGAETPRIRATPRGVDRLPLRNIIFSEGYPDAEPFAQSFTLLNNPVNGRPAPSPGDSLGRAITDASSPLGIASDIGPIH